MGARNPQSTAVIVAICLFAPVAVALDPIGPPAARLSKGQFSASADCSFSSMDLDAKGRSDVTTWDWTMKRVVWTFTDKHSLKLKDFDKNSVYLNLAFGLSGNLDIFLRLGSANMRWRNDDDWGSAIGLGTRASLHETGNLKLGALAQFNWHKSHIHSIPFTTIANGNSYPSEMSGELSIVEMQFAVGTTYNLDNRVSIYGGPFLHFLDGNLELRGISDVSVIPEYEFHLRNSYDLDHVSEFGGYIGTEINIAESISFNIEYQHTAAADGFGMSLIWRF
jgi:hypothetical protein